MSRYLKIGLTVVVVVLAVGAFAVWRNMPRIPERPFVKPPGPHAVGTREFDWTDSTRAEIYTKAPDDKRRVVVQVWYPVAASATGDTARYLVRPGEFASWAGAMVAKKARTNSLWEAPLAPGDSAFPVLVYNHGGAWTRWSATFSTEWLASYGYVVFSIEHFGFNQTKKFPDGTAFASDTLTFPKETGDGKQDALTSWAYLDDPVFKIWAADARFVLDQIERLNRDPSPFQGRLDVERLGMFGWSFGGALAVQMAADDERVKAAVDHDGQLFGDVRQHGTKRPVMQMSHGIDDALAYPEKDRPTVRELMGTVESWDSTAREQSTNDWYKVTIAGTDHGHFSDLAMFLKSTPDQLAAARGHEIINAYTLAFFDRYLRGRDSELLLETSSRFPEVTLRSWIRTSATPASSGPTQR